MSYSIYQRFAKASAAASLSVAAVFSSLPVQAATLAESVGAFSFTNFSFAPLSTDSSTDSSTLTTGIGAQAIADADAQFDGFPDGEALNIVSNAAFTDGPNNSATAESEATVIGDFVANAGETFSFDFSGFLDLFTVTEQPTDFATALLETRYSIFTSDSELDFFSLFGQVSTPDGNDDYDVASSGAITLSELAIFDDFGPSQTAESLSVEVSGRYERFFAQETAFSLVEFKRGKALGQSQDKSQDIPESSSPLVWLVGVGGAIALVRRRAIASSLAV